MARCNVASNLGYFVAGVGVGTVLALLFAPKTGEQTRKLISKKAGEGRDFVASKGRQLRDQAEELVDKGKELASRQKERLAEALEVGKEAARSTLSIV